MRYVLRQKFWSFTDTYTIKDGNLTDVYRIVGVPFYWGHKLSFQTMNADELAFIDQQHLTLMPKYSIYREGELFAEVRKEFSWWNKTFTLDVPGPNDYTITGSFWNQRYTFERMGKDVATAAHTALLPDAYAVDIDDDEDIVSILATCVVIDLVCKDEYRR